MRIDEDERIDLGSFEVRSGLVNITDPCYEADGKCNAIKQRAKRGLWSAEALMSSGRVAVLRASCKGYDFRNLNRTISDDIGVDSGQAGIFDSAFYPEGETGEFEDKTSFYGRVCELTCPTPKEGEEREYPAGGVTENGVVSCSGYGDGCYIATGAYDGDELVAIEIDFGLLEQPECPNCGCAVDNEGELCYDCQAEEDEENERDDEDED